VCAYVGYTKRPGIARYILVALFFALALMSKIMVVTLPFAMVLLDYWPLGRIAGAEDEQVTSGRGRKLFVDLRKSLLEKIPLFAMAGAAALITLRIHHDEGALTSTMPFLWRLKNAAFSYGAYLGKAVWPSNLAAFYPHPANSLAWWKVAAAVAAILAITGLVWRFREERYLIVGWLWFLGTLFPMCGIVQSGRQGMADRYVYISLLGL